MPKYQRTKLDRDIDALLNKAAKKSLSPQDHAKLTKLVQILADLDSDNINDGVDMDQLWELVARSASHKLCRADRAEIRIGAPAPPDLEAGSDLLIPAIPSVAPLCDTSQLLDKIPKTVGKGSKTTRFLRMLRAYAEALPEKEITVFLFLVHHPDRDGPGKDIVVGEPNVIQNQDCTQKAILMSRMIEMVKFIKKDGHSIWVNKKRAEQSRDGKCLPLDLKWMVDLVVGGADGLGIERDTARQVLKMKGFLPTPH
ncbi:hypothetical protein B0H19DRAFT_1074742 [Mycena capillaripes]|nr:hypothetical protein B0H19DRAFT_1074742 [Mycena capillaripes]